MVIIGQYILETNKGYIFNTKNDNSGEEAFKFKPEALRSLFGFIEKSETEFYKSLSKIYCKCINTTTFKIETVTKTPSLNIMNHLDLYSCHKNEFEGLFTRSFRPRKKGILWNIFYLSIQGNNVPTCCDRKYTIYETENIRKIFINEINFDLVTLNIESNEEVIETLFYYFFKDLFKGCKNVNFGNFILKKVAECFVLMKYSRKTNLLNPLEKTATIELHGNISQIESHQMELIEFRPAFLIEYTKNKENYEIENVDINSDILNILRRILKRNSHNRKYSFLRNLDFSSKILINLIKK